MSSKHATSNYLPVALHGTVEQLGPGALAQRLREAQENVIYYQRQRALTDHPVARANAGARVAIWQGEVAAIQRQLDTLNAAAVAGSAA